MPLLTCPPQQAIYLGADRKRTRGKSTTEQHGERIKSWPAITTLAQREMEGECSDRVRGRDPDTNIT